MLLEPCHTLPSATHTLTPHQFSPDYTLTLLIQNFPFGGKEPSLAQEQHNAFPLLSFPNGNEC